MVEEVVGNIIEAEDKAEKIKKEAKETAKQLIFDAQKASDARRAQAVKDARASMTEANKRAAEKANRAYEEVMARGEAEAEKTSKVYEKNMEKAVKAVIDAVLA